MALLELAEVTGDQIHADDARQGLTWLDGRNELGVDMIDQSEHLIYRSIRRRRPLDRFAIYVNTATAFAVRRSLRGRGIGTELFRTCRPYELGWLLAAWCGREEERVR